MKIATDVLEHVKDVCKDSKQMSEMKNSLKKQNPYLKVWMDSVVDQTISEIKSKFNNMNKIKGLDVAIEHSLYDALFHGILASQIECENILNKELNIAFDPMNPYRPEKKLVDSWLNGDLGDEFYKEDPSTYPATHSYRTAHSNFLKRKENREKIEEIRPLVEEAESKTPKPKKVEIEKKMASRGDIVT